MNLIQKVSTFSAAIFCTAALYAVNTPDNKHNNKKIANNEKNINYDKISMFKGIQDKAYTEAALRMNKSALKDTTENNNNNKSFSDFVSAAFIEDSYDYENEKSDDIDEPLIPNFNNKKDSIPGENRANVPEVTADKQGMINPGSIVTNDSKKTYII